LPCFAAALGERTQDEEGGLSEGGSEDDEAEEDEDEEDDEDEEGEQREAKKSSGAQLLARRVAEPCVPAC
jgi:hypothetical protein